MTTVTEIYHPEVVEAFAEAWASIDGKLDRFRAEKGIDLMAEGNTGTYEGFMTEANELLQRANQRINSFDLFDRLSPPNHRLL